MHSLFARRIEAYQQSARAGEDVAEALMQTLTNWLVNHIKHDRDYTGVVTANMQLPSQRAKAQRGRWMRRLFG